MRSFCNRAPELKIRRCGCVAKRDVLRLEKSTLGFIGRHCSKLRFRNAEGTFHSHGHVWGSLRSLGRGVTLCCRCRFAAAKKEAAHLSERSCLPASAFFVASKLERVRPAGRGMAAPHSGHAATCSSETWPHDGHVKPVGNHRGRPHAPQPMQPKLHTAIPFLVSSYFEDLYFAQFCIDDCKSFICNHIAGKFLNSRKRKPHLCSLLNALFCRAAGVERFE